MENEGNGTAYFFIFIIAIGFFYFVFADIVYQDNAKRVCIEKGFNNYTDYYGKEKVECNNLIYKRVCVSEQDKWGNYEGKRCFYVR